MTDFRSIQRQLAKLTTDFARASGDSTVPLFRDFALNYQAEKLAKTNLRSATKSAFEYQVREFLVPAFGHLTLDKVTSYEWDTQIPRWLEEGRLTRLFNTKKCATEIMRKAHEAGYIDRVPKFENPDEPRNVGRVVSEEEFERIQACMTYEIFRLFFFTLRRMGCRPREILRWEWDMVEWPEVEGGKAWINIPARISKTGRNRKIPINSEVWAKLLEWRAQGPMNSKYVFPNRFHPGQPQLSYHGAWRTACTKAGVAHCVPYDYRRTFITVKMENNEPGVFVAKYLDTSMMQIEKTYAKAQAATMEGIAG